MNRELLIEQFCTPPLQEETDFDRTAFSRAQFLDIQFEERILKGYSMGAGRNLLLVHGWGSRASHLSLLARFLATNGFHVLVFDGPAHGYSIQKEQKNISNMFEFARAVSSVARQIEPVYAVIGHSFGATVAGFVLAGTGRMSACRVAAEKLVLISAPDSVSRIIENYSRGRNEIAAMNELTLSLEQAYDFKVSDYDLTTALRGLNAKTLIIHDEEDEEIPVSDALRLKEVNEGAKLVLTKGSGHQRILISRQMLGAVKEFL